MGLRGKLVSIDASTVKVRPMDSSIQTEIAFLTSQVRKYIVVGAHVKVTDGRYANETGTVVAVEEMDGASTAVVSTDVTSKEISVRTSQLRDSVVVDRPMKFRVIVRVGQKDFTELRGKQNSAVAFDKQGNQNFVAIRSMWRKDCTRAATIKRMNRSQLFLHSQTRTEHAGIFVVRSCFCVLSGSSQKQSSAVAPLQQQHFPAARLPEVVATVLWWERLYASRRLVNGKDTPGPFPIRLTLMCKSNRGSKSSTCIRFLLNQCAVWQEEGSGRPRKYPILEQRLEDRNAFRS